MHLIHYDVEKDHHNDVDDDAVDCNDYSCQLLYKTDACCLSLSLSASAAAAAVASASASCRHLAKASKWAANKNGGNKMQLILLYNFYGFFCLFCLSAAAFNLLKMRGALLLPAVRRVGVGAEGGRDAA